MPATYVSVAKVYPSTARVVQITDVEEGDRIDLEDALGRPARRLQMYTSDAADIVEYTLNSHKKIRSGREHEIAVSGAEQLFGTYGTTVSDLWSGSSRFPSLSSTGAIIETAEGLTIKSIQIDALTLSVGSSITIIAW